MLFELCHCLYFGRSQPHSFIFVDASFWCDGVQLYHFVVPFVCNCLPFGVPYCTLLYHILPCGVPYCLLVCLSQRSTRRTLSDAHNLPGVKPITYK